MSEDDATVREYMKRLGENAKAAARAMGAVTAEQKKAALRAAAAEIHACREDILAANADDVAAAERDGRPPAFIDRMALDEKRIEGIGAALADIANLDDPTGRIIKQWERPNGLKIERVCTPIGVVAVIYESRPNVTVDAAAIAMMAGNAVILRGGSECINTSKALFDAFMRGLAAHNLPAHAAQFVETADRGAVGEILAGLDGNVDLVIPRGGKSLVARVQAEARAPVLSHLDGVCHVYLDAAADPKKATAIAVNAKMRRPGVCGAAETLLIDRAKLEHLWPPVSAALREAGCELRGDAAVRAIDPEVAPATDEDFHTEYLAPILSVAAVDGVDGAVEHIAHYSSGHTEAIVTENDAAAERFITGVDSAIVMRNASTQYADGGEFGLGAEIGIATGRLHARGPVGVEELTTYKNVVRGDGQVRP